MAGHMTRPLPVLAVHSAQTIVEDVHLQIAIDVMSWAFVKQVNVPFPSLVQCFITFLFEVVDFFKLLSGLGWWIVPLDKGFLRRSQETTVLKDSLSTHLLVALVSVMGKMRSMTALCVTPGMLNKQMM
nr:hypothetical protein [Tanacetum cinerariifolium]